MRYIIVSGNPVDGFTYIGPYVEAADAVEAAEYVSTADWWIAPLEQSVSRPR